MRKTQAVRARESIPDLTHEIIGFDPVQLGNYLTAGESRNRTGIQKLSLRPFDVTHDQGGIRGQSAKLSYSARTGHMDAMGDTVCAGQLHGQISSGLLSFERVDLRIGKPQRQSNGVITFSSADVYHPRWTLADRALHERVNLDFVGAEQFRRESAARCFGERISKAGKRAGANNSAGLIHHRAIDAMSSLTPAAR